MKNIAPSYIAAVVAVLVNVQSFAGLALTSDELTTTITVVCTIVVAIRQVITGKSNLIGGRPA